MDLLEVHGTVSPALCENHFSAFEKVLCTAQLQSFWSPGELRRIEGALLFLGLQWGPAACRIVGSGLSALPPLSRVGDEPGVSGTEFSSLSPWGLKGFSALGLKLTVLSRNYPPKIKRLSRNVFFFPPLKRINVSSESDGDINSGEWII